MLKCKISKKAFAFRNRKAGWFLALVLICLLLFLTGFSGKVEGSEQPILSAPWIGDHPISQGNNCSDYSHNGYWLRYAIDVSMAIGNYVVAPADGTVIQAGLGYDTAGGSITVRLLHQGPTGKSYISSYLHLSAVELAVGDQVLKGQVIAKSGKTGIVTNPHLHFELGEVVNPADLTAIEASIKSKVNYNKQFPSIPIESLVMKRLGPAEYADAAFRHYDATAGDLDHNTLIIGYPKNLFQSPQRLIARPPLDLIFLIDTTGSMWDDIDSVKADAANIVDKLAGYDYRVAVVDYRDFPVSPYGSTGDYPYNDVLGFTKNKSQIIDAINSLTLGDGGDWEESVLSGVMHSLKTKTLGGWRTEATKVIIVMGDAPGHDPEPFTGYTRTSVIASAKDERVKIYSVVIGSPTGSIALGQAETANSDVITTADYYTDTLTFFTTLSKETGGEVFTAETASEVPNAIKAAIGSIIIQSFFDVLPDFQFYPHIEAICAAGITTGYSDGTYRPYVEVSRGQMAAFLARALGLPTGSPPAVSPFSDVSSDFQFYPYIMAIYEAGITTGYSDGTYRPYTVVTRGQMAAFLARALDLPTGSPPAVSPFSDLSPDFQFYPHIMAIYEAEITTGYSDGTYRPYVNVTRGQMAAFLARAFDLLD